MEETQNVNNSNTENNDSDNKKQYNSDDLFNLLLVPDDIEIQNNESKGDEEKNLVDGQMKEKDEKKELAKEELGTFLTIIYCLPAFTKMAALVLFK